MLAQRLDSLIQSRPGSRAHDEKTHNGNNHKAQNHIAYTAKNICNHAKLPHEPDARRASYRTHWLVITQSDRPSSRMALRVGPVPRFEVIGSWCRMCPRRHQTTLRKVIAGWHIFQLFLPHHDLRGVRNRSHNERSLFNVDLGDLPHHLLSLCLIRGHFGLIQDLLQLRDGSLRLEARRFTLPGVGFVKTLVLVPGSRQRVISSLKRCPNLP